MVSLEQRRDVLGCFASHCENCAMMKCQDGKSYDCVLYMYRTIVNSHKWNVIAAKRKC